MKSSELISLLEKLEGLVSVKSKLAHSLDAFRKALQIRGASAPVELTTENTPLLVCAKHIKCICEGYLMGILDDVEVDYIATALSLCPDFIAESEDIQNAVYRLSDIRQAKPYEREQVEEILESLH